MGVRIDNNGDKRYYLGYKLHREGGPAVEMEECKKYYLNGKLHREDGPAIEYKDVFKAYVSNDKLQRLNINTDDVADLEIIHELLEDLFIV